MITSQNGTQELGAPRRRRAVLFAAIGLAASMIPALTTLSPTFASTTAAGTRAGTDAAANASDPASLVYTALNPGRICDTRSGNPSGLSGAAAQCNGKTLSAGGSITVDMPTEVVPATAQAVVLSVAVTNTAGQGFITVWPAGQSMPTVSSLDYTHGQTISNTVTVGLGTDSANGDRAVSIYNGPPTGTGGTADVVVDIEGYYAPQGSNNAGQLTPLTPARLADTRCGRSPNGAGAACSSEDIPSANDSLNYLSAGNSINVQVAGLGGVPATGASAAVLNVTVTNAFGTGYISAYPTGTASPASSLTPFSNQQYSFDNTLSTKVLVPLGSNGQVSIFDGPAKGGGDIDIIVDVDGYFSSASGPTGSLFVPTTPTRLLDNRVTDSPLAPGSSEPLAIAGANSVPSGASGAVLNVTDVPTKGNYLTVYPDDETLPTGSDVNYSTSDPYDVLPNAAYSKLGADGGVKIYNGPPDTSNNAASAFVVVDLFGYFISSPSTVTANSITLAASPAAIPVNASGSTSSTSTITATVTSSSGAPVTGDTITFVGVGYPSGDCGTLSSTTATTGSAGTAIVTYTAGTSPGFCFLGASESQSGKQAATTLVQEPSPVPSPAYTLTISASPSSVAASGTASSTVTVTVKDSSGNPVQNDPVALAAFGSPTGACGSLSTTTVTTGSGGTAVAAYTSSSTTGSCTIGAVEADTDQTANTVITQTASTTGPKNTITVSANPSTVLLGTSSTITATVTNSSGAAVPNDTVTFSLGGDCILGIIPSCSISPTTATTNSSGVATTTLSGLGVVGSGTITATDSSGGSGSTTVTVLVQL